MKLAALKGNARRVDVVFKEEDGFDAGQMWVEYNPGELTIDVIENIQKGMEGHSETEAILEMMSKILVGWDLEEDVLDEAGNPTGSTVPVLPTEDGVRKLPLPAIGYIFGTIMEDIKPNPPKDEASEDGSPPEATSDSSPNGTSSFAPQDTTESPLGISSTNP